MGAGVSAQGEAQLLLLLRQSHGMPCRWGDQGRKTLGENLARTGGVVAEELAHVQQQADDTIGPGQVGDRATVVAVNTHCWGLTRWAGTAGGNGLNCNGNLLGVAINCQVLDPEACAQWQEIGQQIHG